MLYHQAGQAAHVFVVISSLLALVENAYGQRGLGTQDEPFVLTGCLDQYIQPRCPDGLYIHVHSISVTYRMFCRYDAVVHRCDSTLAGGNPAYDVIRTRCEDTFRCQYRVKDSHMAQGCLVTPEIRDEITGVLIASEVRTNRTNTVSLSWTCGPLGVPNQVQTPRSPTDTLSTGTTHTAEVAKPPSTKQTSAVLGRPVSPILKEKAAINLSYIVQPPRPITTAHMGPAIIGMRQTIHNPAASSPTAPKLVAPSPNSTTQLLSDNPGPKTSPSQTIPKRTQLNHRTGTAQLDVNGPAAVSVPHQMKRVSVGINPATAPANQMANGASANNSQNAPANHTPLVISNNATPQRTVNIQVQRLNPHGPAAVRVGAGYNDHTAVQPPGP